jgi:electron transfer flavoprotein alpha subunit
MADAVLLIVPRASADELGKTDAEALAVAHSLAEIIGASLACAVIGADVDAAADEVAERGVDHVLVAAVPHLGSGGDAVVAAGVEAVRAVEPDVVLIPRGQDVGELAPRLAARVGGGSVAGVEEVRRSSDGHIEAVAAVFGGAARAVYRFTAGGPAVVGLAPILADPPPREQGRTVTRTVLDVPEEAEPSVSVVETAVDTGAPRIEDARVVVSGGRGLQDGDNFHLVRELADALGGMPGASRAVVDDGWAPPSEQVGLTGAIVTPDVYVAAGISGASQHMAGCSNARVIVAINSDPTAPIFRYAHFGIVDDCLEVLPELTRLRNETASS